MFMFRRQASAEGGGRLSREIHEIVSIPQSRVPPRAALVRSIVGWSEVAGETLLPEGENPEKLDSDLDDR
ncbi:unnamed protein product [Protopolystoma xenopodis]|uniref:Uncharacterized protein n=1 Tax=Protopolystoma xenopodis TaxID=117903 RepID=A0A448XRL4_9PLAT|nr:unnamed protein product [Protopolystoma xenopodis]